MERRDAVHRRHGDAPRAQRGRRAPAPHALELALDGDLVLDGDPRRLVAHAGADARLAHGQRDERLERVDPRYTAPSPPSSSNATPAPIVRGKARSLAHDVMTTRAPASSALRRTVPRTRAP